MTCSKSRHHWKRFRLLVSILSVYLFDTFVHCAQTAKDRPIDEIFCIRQRHVSSDGLALKFGAYQSTPSPQILLQIDPCTLYWLKRRRHSTANCNRMVRDIAMVAIIKQHRKPSLTPTTALFPKWRSQMYTPESTLRRLLPAGEYDRKHRQDLFCICIW